MRHKSALMNPAQLGFDSFLAEADTINKAAAFERTHGHLPGTMDEALPFYRDLTQKHHAAMLAADFDTVMALREEASKLALKLNGGEPGILASPDAPGCRLASLTAAPDGTFPLWGQAGRFTIEVNAMRVRIDMDGMFGIGARFMPWMNFSANAVDWDKPFLSETGYRSFMGLHAALVPGLTPDAFAREVIGETRTERQTADHQRMTRAARWPGSCRNVLKPTKFQDAVIRAG